MPNILINPRSGILEFNTGIAGSSAFDTNLSGLRMTYDNFGAINLLSYNTDTSSGLDRFTIDGSNGRLFAVTDNLVGSLFSVNDIAGLPIIEAFDDNTIVMGAFNRNDFIITGGCVGIGTLPNTGFTKLLVNGTGVFGTSNTNYTRLTSNPLSVIGSGNTFVQLNIQNLAIGDAASSDLVLTSNAGTDDSFYLDLGINNSGYNQAAYNIGNSGDGYLYIHGGNLTIGTQSPNRTIKFHTDGTTLDNQIAEINSTGYFSPNKSVIAVSGIFGRNNTVTNTIGAFIGGGSGNTICNLTTNFAHNSSIVGGLCNRVSSYANNSFIAGGTGNIIASTCWGFIGGGCANNISSVVNAGYDYNFIGNGRGNSISITTANGSIINGISNSIFAGRDSIILNGCCNYINACMSLIGGICNYITHPVGLGCSFMYGFQNSGYGSIGFTFGSANRNEGDFSSILGGICNKIHGAQGSSNSFNSIVGGQNNCIGAYGSLNNYVGKYNFIGGGLFNNISGVIANPVCSNMTYASAIVGGQNNSICSDYSAILGGRCSQVGHHGATVIGDGSSRVKCSVGACTLALDFCCGISLANNILFDATPQILRVNSNFNITTGYNSRMILVNSAAAPVTGFLTSGQVNGFNASLIQIGAGQIQITGSGIGITFNSYNNQYKSAGQYSTISVLHTGNDGYIMYGNTTL
jgi:hypothetical protein